VAQHPQSNVAGSKRSVLFSALLNYICRTKKLLQQRRQPHQSLSESRISSTTDMLAGQWHAYRWSDNFAMARILVCAALEADDGQRNAIHDFRQAIELIATAMPGEASSINDGTRL